MRAKANTGLLCESLPVNEWVNPLFLAQFPCESRVPESLYSLYIRIYIHTDCSLHRLIYAKLSVIYLQPPALKILPEVHSQHDYVCVCAEQKNISDLLPTSMIYMYHQS